MALLVILLALGLWLRNRETDLSTATTATLGTAAMAARLEPQSRGIIKPDPARRQARAARGVAGIPSVAPPPDSPLFDSYRALRESALAGDAGASCRLGTELARCASYMERLAMLDEEMARASALAAGSPEEGAQLKALAAARMDLAASEQVCRGITPSQAREGWRFVYRAAKAGHLPAMLAFAIRPPLSESNFTADLEGWSLYRQEAVAMLQQAASRGSARAAYQLAWIYGNLPIAGGAPLVPRDAVAATGYALVARPHADPRSSRQIDRMIGRWRAEIGTSGWMQARSWATEHSVPGLAEEREGFDFVNGTVPQPEDCGP